MASQMKRARTSSLEGETRNCWNSEPAPRKNTGHSCPINISPSCAGPSSSASSIQREESCSILRDGMDTLLGQLVG